MKLPIATTILAAISLALCFLAPHHVHPPDSFKPRTLGGIYRGFWRDIRSHDLRKVQLLILFGILAIFAAGWPIAFLLILRRVAAGHAAVTDALFIVAGLLSVTGAVINFVAILVSNMAFGWGMSQGRNQTPFMFIIPAWQLLFGIATIVLGTWSRGADAVVNWLAVR
jgi:hypothetical protein